MFDALNNEFCSSGPFHKIFTNLKAVENEFYFFVWVLFGLDPTQTRTVASPRSTDYPDTKVGTNSGLVWYGLD